MISGLASFAFFAGWGKVAFPGTYNGAASDSATTSGYPSSAPLVGGVIGALAYDFFIGDVLQARLARTGSAGEAPSEPGEAQPNVQPSRV